MPYGFLFKNKNKSNNVYDISVGTYLPFNNFPLLKVEIQISFIQFIITYIRTIVFLKYSFLNY